MKKNWVTGSGDTSFYKLTRDVIFMLYSGKLRHGVIEFRNKSYFIKNWGRDRGAEENISPYAVIIDELDNLREPELLVIRKSETTVA